ncbi:hypothetical protein HY008_02950 [Candidatus Woesebacteria bacterium]|nr:hypothetical protein [Candidatus Woesebacteria bacterium]
MPEIGKNGHKEMIYKEEDFLAFLQAVRQAGKEGIEVSDLGRMEYEHKTVRTRVFYENGDLKIWGGNGEPCDINETVAYKYYLVNVGSLS